MNWKAWDATESYARGLLKKAVADNELKVVRVEEFVDEKGRPSGKYRFTVELPLEKPRE